MYDICIKCGYGDPPEGATSPFSSYVFHILSETILSFPKPVLNVSKGFFSRINTWNVTEGFLKKKNTTTPTWLACGTTLQSSFNCSRWWTRKLLTPIARHTPIVTNRDTYALWNPPLCHYCVTMIWSSFLTWSSIFCTFFIKFLQSFPGISSHLSVGATRLQCLWPVHQVQIWKRLVDLPSQVKKGGWELLQWQLRKLKFLYDIYQSQPIPKYSIPIREQESRQAFFAALYP